jgi:hypothetical protein
MSAKKFQSMTELSGIIREKITKLETGQLPADELECLTGEIRDLYERLVVLSYKAMEKGLKVSKPEPVVSVPVLNEKMAEPVPVKPEITPIKFSVSEEIAAKVIIQPEPETIKEEKPVAVTIPEVKPNPVVEPQKVQPGLFESSQQDIIETKTSIAEKYAVQQKTSIAEKFAAEQKMTLADKLKMTRINDLRTAIGINQKFLFMNDLFEGENTMFNNAINRLNSCGGGDEAKNVFVEYATKYGWDHEAERVKQFYELIERRYL